LFSGNRCFLKAGPGRSGPSTLQGSFCGYELYDRFNDLGGVFMRSLQEKPHCKFNKNVHAVSMFYFRMRSILIKVKL
jgi:hypothetical protein